MELDDQLRNAINVGDYKRALQKFASVELDIEDGVTDISEEQFVQFYSVYLIVFLISGDLNGAKYLWKRSTDFLKNDSNSKFTDIWSVAKFLWRDEYPSALKSLKTIHWPANIATYIEVFKNSLIENQLQMVSSAYSVIKIAQIADVLSTTKEETEQLVQHLGWRLENDLVYPTVRDAGDAQRREAVEKLSENLHVMERITSYAAQFDRASLKVDLSGKDSTSGKTAKVR